MNCGNCGKANAYRAKVCAHCGSNLSMTEYFKRTGFKDEPSMVEKISREVEQQKKVPMPPKPAQQKQGKAKQGNKQVNRSNSQGGKAERREAPAKPQTPGKSKKVQPQGSKKGSAKKASAPKAYNRTTSHLSIAEKEVKKKIKGPNRKWIYLAILILCIIAIAVFIGRVQFYRDDSRYTEVAEQFVEAVAMNDGQLAAQCVHPSMHGTLRSLGYENVDRCEAYAMEHEELELGQIDEELRQRFGIEDTITRVFRVSVKYTIYGEKDYACTMDVLVANIGGTIYAIKTENIKDSQISPD